MFIGQVLKGPVLTKFKNAVIDYTDIERDEAEDQWGLGKPQTFCKTDGIVRDSDEITAKDMCANLYQYIWFMLGR